jgi:MFS family permease
MFSNIPSRFAYGMLTLSIFFYVHEKTDSVAIAGLASGVETLAGSLGAGFRGNLIDRYGQTKPLMFFVPCWALVLGSLAFVDTSAEILFVSVFIGLFSPPINITTRPLWRMAVGSERLRTAYSLDTTLMNSTSVLGPVLATYIALHFNGRTALLVTAVLMLVGGVLMVTMPLSRKWVPEPHSGNSFSLWKHKPFVIMAGEGLIFGLGWGLLDISIPATATLNGTPELAAPLLAILTGTSILAGVITGMRKSTMTALAGFRRASVVAALATLPLSFVQFGWQLAIALAALGFAIGFAQIYHMEVLEAVRPIGSATSAQAWLWAVEGSAMALGVAGGGWIVEKYTAHLALALVTLGLCSSTLYIIFFASSRLQAANKPLSDDEMAQAISNLESSLE